MGTFLGEVIIALRFGWLGQSHWNRNSCVTLTFRFVSFCAVSFVSAMICILLGYLFLFHFSSFSPLSVSVQLKFCPPHTLSVWAEKNEESACRVPSICTIKHLNDRQKLSHSFIIFRCFHGNSLNSTFQIAKSLKHFYNVTQTCNARGEVVQLNGFMSLIFHPPFVPPYQYIYI